MARKNLPRATDEKLGLPTIMDRDLAAQHGVAYVHLAAFAIDVDRVREAVEGYGDPRPFGWEVFLTEAYLLDRTIETPLLEDTVLSILDGEANALGSQLVFAVWDAMERRVLPRANLVAAFASWRAKPKELVQALAPLWQDEARWRRELAQAALAVEITPPLAPPTREALEALARA